VSLSEVRIAKPLTQSPTVNSKPLTRNR